ncbi:MAG: hypothetical protein V4622_09865 [Bacteroidota bacterium]
MSKDFENKVRQIHDYFFSYGLRKIGVSINSDKEMKEFMRTNRTLFISSVHEGQRLGQELLITELISIESKIKELTQEKKQLNRVRDKSGAQKKEIQIQIQRYNDAILRNLADSLVWVLIREQHWIARRWYSGQKGRPSLLNSNIESLHLASKAYYEKDPDGFVLYADLTTFVDIFDLIYVDSNGRLKLVEVKEGSKSKEVLDFINKLEENPKMKPEDMRLEKIENPEKFFDQVDRTLNQMQKGTRFHQLLKEEKGSDPFTGTETTIAEITKPLRHYDGQILDMFEILESKTWAYRIIENVICVGMYKEEALYMANFVFKQAVSYKFQENFPIIHYNSALFAPIKQPIFLKRFGTENVMNIVFGKVKLLLSVDLNALIELFNSKGIEAKWMSTKETQKAKDVGDKKHKLFEYQKRAISLTYNEKTSILGDGFLSRLVYDNLLPESLVDMLLEKFQIESVEDNQETNESPPKS